MKLYKKILTDRWGRRQDNFDWRTYQLPLDIRTIDNFCLLHLNEKLGDAIVNSLLVDALVKARPDLPIRVVTTAPFQSYWSAHPHVHEVIVAPPKYRGQFRTFRGIKELRQLGFLWRGRLDCVVSYDSYASPEHFAFLDALAPRVLIGFNKHNFALFDYSLEEGRHGVQVGPIANRAALVMRVFDLEADCGSLGFHVPCRQEDAAKAEAVVQRLPTERPRLLFHVYGAGKEKLMKPATVAVAARILREAGHTGPMFISVPPGQNAAYQAALDEERVGGEWLVIGPMVDTFGLVALVEKMDMVVATDTAVGHVAAALGKPQVCVFTRRINVPITWKPYNRRCVNVISTTGRNANDLDWSEFADAARRVMVDASSDVLVRQG